MILHHVAQGTRFFVESAPVTDADRLRDRDLHVVDVVAVPNGLEDAVGKAEHEDVLHRLLAQVVIDAEHLVFLEIAGEQCV